MIEMVLHCPYTRDLSHQRWPELEGEKQLEPKAVASERQSDSVIVPENQPSHRQEWTVYDYRRCRDSQA